MRTPFALLMLLALALQFTTLTQVHAQKRPAQLVENQRQKGADFKNVELFETINEGRTRTVVAEELHSDYTLLHLDAEMLRQLRKSDASTMILNIPQAGRSHLQLELVQVDLFAGGPLVKLASTDSYTRINPGLHYRGTVKGDPGSIASISIFDDEVMGLISTSGAGNLVLGKLSHEQAEGEHILYNDTEVMANNNFQCDTPDDGPAYTREQLENSLEGRTTDKCVGVYFEVDYDIYLNKGGTSGVVNYITGLFNEVATLYANENVTINISELYIWNTSSPYSGTSSSSLLSQFQGYRTSFNGDVAQLLSYQASGGIAVLQGLCHPITAARMSFSSINTSYSTVPVYSFTIMVVAHELGHLLGSQHTHACVWNGNNTAIDGCAGFTEGNCGNPGLPSNGGTIMSYCHITNTGINFNKGFGDQPGNVIRSFINNATCIGTCTTGGGGGNNGGGGGNPTASDCDNNEVFLTIELDGFAKETSWELLDEDGEVVEEFGPYAKSDRNKTMRDTFCLPDGCYSFKIMDDEGDGLCCEYGDGSYSLIDSEGNVLASGGDFDDEEETDLCLPYSDDPVDPNCMIINFNDHDILSFGGSQDGGQYEIQSGGDVLMIENNAWKAIALEYTVTAQTVIEFDFGSTRQGEIHGLGFDDNNSISSSKTFKVHGTQSWGIQSFDNYSNPGSWKRYTIPIGEYYTGNYIRLFFVADHDSSPRNGNSFFRNVVIYEGAGCGSNLVMENEITELPGEAAAMDLEVFPNPATNYINLEVEGGSMAGAVVELYDMMGQKILDFEWTSIDNPNRLPIDVSNLPQGSYMVRVRKDERQLTKKFTVVR